jgi:sugar phosphate isomerase/epimerase
MDKRHFLKSLVSIPAMASYGLWSGTGVSLSKIKTDLKRHKISLNAYSFNGPLSRGEMDLDDVFDFCAEHGFDAVDPTGYYFPGYPDVPPDRYLYDLKRKAFDLGLEISGTGIRNDFTVPDPDKRKSDILLIKNWIIAAEKMGIPVIRIFSGTQLHEAYSWEEVAEWMVRDIKECVEFGKDHGVVVAVQNHADFIQNADHVQKLIQMVDSPWFGLILDTGSYGGEDPYEEIRKTVPFAVSWQVKELINRNGRQEPIDLPKLMGIIKDSSYIGYLPIETLGPGDPFEKVPVFLAKVGAALYP